MKKNEIARIESLERMNSDLYNEFCEFVPDYVKAHNIKANSKEDFLKKDTEVIWKAFEVFFERYNINLSVLRDNIGRLNSIVVVFLLSDDLWPFIDTKDIIGDEDLDEDELDDFAEDELDDYDDDELIKDMRKSRIFINNATIKIYKNKL